MNSVVCYPYLVHEILWYEREHNMTLAACARVSKIWHNEACSLLWSEQDGLDNILRLLKPGVQNTPTERHLELAGLPNISCLLHYSKWIRYIKCNHDISIDADALVNAQVLAAGECLFPSLRKLTMDKDFSVYGLTVTVAICLIGSSLEEIEFGGAPPQITALILATAVKHPCRLVTVCIECVTTLQDDRTIFCEFIKAASELKNVTAQTSWLDFDVMQALGQLWRLSDLSLICIGDLVRNEVSSTDPLNSRETLDRFSQCTEIWFCSLTSLRLRCYSFVITSLLETVFAHAQLVVLDARFMVVSQDANRSIKLPLDTSRVTTIMLVWKLLNPAIDVASFPRLDKQALQRLSCCRALESLMIWHLRVPKLCDSDILSLSKCWPGLRRLGILSSCISFLKQDMPVMTVAVLDGLPKLCPRLSALSFSVAGTVDNPPPVQNLPASLTRVSLHDSFLFDPIGPGRKDRIMEIAAYLCVALPSSCDLDFLSADTLLRWGHLHHPGISNTEWATLNAGRTQSIGELKDYIRLSRMVRKLVNPPSFNQGV